MIPRCHDNGRACPEPVQYTAGELELSPSGTLSQVSGDDHHIGADRFEYTKHGIYRLRQKRCTYLKI
jgi:hypothetical protein